MTWYKKYLGYAIIVLCVVFFYKYVYDGTSSVRSSFNNNSYKVQNGGGSQEKADLLALLHIKLETIVRGLQSSNYNSQMNVQRLVSNWNKGVQIKEMGKMESDAAYVINKQYMSFCLPEGTSSSIDSVNLMTYVAIHELAHIMSDEIGHGSEFVKNFEFLLKYAKTITYLDPKTNTNLPVYIQLDKLNTASNYCGVPLVNSIN